MEHGTFKVLLGQLFFGSALGFGLWQLGSLHRCGACAASAKKPSPAPITSADLDAVLGHLYKKTLIPFGIGA